MRVMAIIQARIGSKRLPGKVQMDIGGWPMIKHVTERVGKVLPWFLAWPIDGIPEDDVLARYYQVATDLALDGIIRVTGDCPLMAPEAITDVLGSFHSLYRVHPYIANDLIPSYPNGLGVEAFTYAALERAHREATKSYDREHVSPYMKRDKLNNAINISCPINGLSDLKLSVDTQEDLDFVRAIDAAQPRDYSLAATLEAIEHVQNNQL